MLDSSMTDELEYVQKRACKIIFGWNSNYDELVAAGKIETLFKRREKLTLSFAEKSAKNPRFEHWFKEKNYNGLNLRRGLNYEENYDFQSSKKVSLLFHFSIGKTKLPLTLYHSSYVSTSISRN